MRIFQFLYNLYIVQFYIEELIDRFEDAFYGDVVLELDGYFVVDEGFEEAMIGRSAEKDRRWKSEVGQEGGPEEQHGAAEGIGSACSRAFASSI